MLAIDNLFGTAFTGEVNAHTFEISGVNDAGTVALSGNVTGTMLAANNVNVPLTGSIQDGCAVVTLTDECYEVPGRFVLSIYITEGGKTMCVYCGVGTITNTDGDAVAYPSAAIPDIQQLINDLQTLIGQIPADYSALNQSVTDLKSAFSSDLVSIHPTWVQGKYIEPGTGNAGTSSSFYATDYIEVEPNATMVFYAAMASTAALAFYDENKYYVSGYVDDDLYVQRSVKIPANAHYARYSCRADYHDFSSRQEQIGTIYFLNQVDAVRESIPDMNGYVLDMAKKANSVISWNAVSATGIGGLVDIGNTVRTGSGYAASCSVSEGELYRISGRQFSSYPTDSTVSFGSAYLLRSSGSIVKIGWVAEAGYFSNLEILIPSGVDELVVNLNSSAGLSGAIKKANIINLQTVNASVQQNTSGVTKLLASAESYPNIANINDVILGLNFIWGVASDRAILYVPVEAGKSYYVSVPASTKITKVQVVPKAIESGGSLGTVAVNAGNTALITAPDGTKVFCLQFESGSALTASDFADYDLVVKQGDANAVTDIDAYARDAAMNCFDNFHDMVLANRVGENRVGGYILRNKTANPHLLLHTQEAWGTSNYYDVNSSVEQYETLNYPSIAAQHNILNHLPQEEIDFTPSDNDFTRIIMGKSSDDVFFVSYVASERSGSFGNALLDAVEITNNFTDFTTIIKGDGQTGDGIEVTGKRYLKLQTVKQFADGSFLVPLRCHDISSDADGTYFYKLSADMQTLTPCQYTNLSGSTVEMKDEFAGTLYDWHVDIQGAKGICTTYGSRDPSTDYGRVWYTEDNGNTWKQVFQMTNHYQDGVAEGTTITQTHMHGVFLDPYSDRMYIVAGEDNRNIFWSDKGINTTDNDWNVIPIRDQSFYQIRGYSQVVGGYAFKDALVFGSDNSGLGTIDRLNKLDGGEYSMLEPAHEFLPNAFKGTNYCMAEQYRRDMQTPLLFCMTRENSGTTEADNEALNNKHRGRVVASYDGIKWTEVWTDDTYGSHAVYVGGANTTRNYSYCTRGMNCFLLKNGDAVIKYSGRDLYYFGGTSYVSGYSNGSCKVRYIHGAEKYLK